MIEPEEIIEKAERLYPKAVTAILSGVNDFFPHRLACNLKPPADHADLIASVGRLRMNSKASLGYGYSVSYQPRRSHDHGANDFPEAIIIGSMDDLVRLVRKSTEFNKLTKAVEFLRAGLPELETWIRCNWRKLIAASDDIPHC